VNLVRTHSTGQFFVVGSHSSSSGSISSDSDVEMDTASRPSTPADTARTILIDSARLPTDVSRRPTIEQNMAFAALKKPPDTTPAAVVETHDSDT
jgi:hypothetical protein